MRLQSQDSRSGRDSENVYEIVSDEDTSTESSSIRRSPRSRLTSAAQSTYEDIGSDVYDEDLSSSDYLEPVGQQADNSLLSEMNFFEDGTPIPSARGGSQSNGVHRTAEQYVLLYANKEILADKTRPPTNLRDAYFHMATLNLETLHRLADQIYNKVLSPCQKKSTLVKLFWSDFVKTDAKPMLTQGNAAFYKVKGHTIKKVELSEFIIMVSFIKYLILV